LQINVACTGQGGCVRDVEAEADIGRGAFC